MARASHVVAEFVGGPMCGFQQKARLDIHGQPPKSISQGYTLSRQKLVSGAIAYGYTYNKGRCIADTTSAG